MKLRKRSSVGSAGRGGADSQSESAACKKTLSSRRKRNMKAFPSDDSRCGDDSTSDDEAGSFDGGNVGRRKKKKPAARISDITEAKTPEDNDSVDRSEADVYEAWFSKQTHLVATRGKTIHYKIGYVGEEREGYGKITKLYKGSTGECLIEPPSGEDSF